MSAAPQPATELKITTCRLAEIQLDSKYLRLESDVETLKRSIESVGLIHPLTINSNNQLLAGARRYCAVRELGWETVPVQVVDRDELIQELISIDENLVRAPLKNLELDHCLNRGRELYETLYPTANKVDLSAEELTVEEKRQQKELEEQDQDSFAAVTAEKTGLSKSAIKSAIKRDELASAVVKKARGEGELNATQTNEIIKLEKDTQEQVLPLIANKSAKETRKIVLAAKREGVSAAIEESEKFVPMPPEYSQILSPVRRIKKNIQRILEEDIGYDGPEKGKIHKELQALRESLDQYFQRVGSDDTE